MHKISGCFLISLFLATSCASPGTGSLADSQVELNAPNTEFEDVFEEGFTYTIDSEGNLFPVNEAWNENFSLDANGQATQSSEGSSGENSNEYQYFSPDELAHLPVTLPKTDEGCGFETEGDIQLLVQNSSSTGSRFLTTRALFRPAFSTKFLDGGTISLKNSNLGGDNIDLIAARCQANINSDEEETYTWRQMKPSELENYSLVVMQTGRFLKKKTWAASDDFLLVGTNQSGTFRIQTDTLLDGLSATHSSLQDTKTHFILKRSL